MKIDELRGVDDSDKYKNEQSVIVLFGRDRQRERDSEMERNREKMVKPNKRSGNILNKLRMYRIRVELFHYLPPRSRFLFTLPTHSEHSVYCCHIECLVGINAFECWIKRNFHNNEFNNSSASAYFLSIFTLPAHSIHAKLHRI